MATTHSMHPHPYPQSDFMGNASSKDYNQLHERRFNCFYVFLWVWLSLILIGMLLFTILGAMTAIISSSDDLGYLPWYSVYFIVFEAELLFRLIRAHQKGDFLAFKNWRAITMICLLIIGILYSFILAYSGMFYFDSVALPIGILVLELAAIPVIYYFSFRIGNESTMTSHSGNILHQTQEQQIDERIFSNFYFALWAQMLYMGVGVSIWTILLILEFYGISSAREEQIRIFFWNIAMIIYFSICIWFFYNFIRAFEKRVFPAIEQVISQLFAISLIGICSGIFCTIFFWSHLTLVIAADCLLFLSVMGSLSIIAFYIFKIQGFSIVSTFNESSSAHRHQDPSAASFRSNISEQLGINNIGKDQYMCLQILLWIFIGFLVLIAVAQLLITIREKELRDGLIIGFIFLEMMVSYNLVGGYKRSNLEAVKSVQPQLLAMLICGINYAIIYAVLLYGNTISIVFIVLAVIPNPILIYYSRRLEEVFESNNPTSTTNGTNDTGTA